MSFAEDKAKELNGFLRAHKIKTTVLMLDSPIGEEDGKGRSVWLGYEGVTHKMSDGEIRGEVGELLRIEADNEAFLPKKMKN